MPVYLFAVVQSIDDGQEELDCYYKRFTPILTGDTIPERYAYYADFYKVNEGDSFIAFRHLGAFGFARDLFIDHVRWCYYKGSITYLDPRAIGLSQFGADGLFIDLFESYKERVCSVYDKTRQYLERLGYR